MPARSNSEWKITSVRSGGNYVDLELSGTNLPRFHIDASTLKFIDRVAPKTSAPAHDASAVFERIAIIQRENLQRLDDEIAILKQYLKTEGAPKPTMATLETLSNEVHASWQVAIQDIEGLIEER